MGKYIVRRLLLFIPTILGAATLIFLIMNILPGDVALTILSAGGEASVRDEDLAALRETLGLNRPLYVQYFSWLWDILRLDFGDSIWSGEPVLKEVAKRIPLSLELAVLATVFSTVVAIPLGILSAIRQDSVLDYSVRLFAYIGHAVPGFWAAILLILFLFYAFKWVAPLGYVSLFKDPVKNLTILIWPTLVLGLRNVSVIARMTRSCMLEVLREDYIRTARAKGLSEQTMLVRHALKNALLPVVTIIAIEIAFLFGALIIIESIFTLPGMGRYLVDAIRIRDIPVVQSIIVIIAFWISLVNLVTDILYAWLDPRIRYA